MIGTGLARYRDFGLLILRIGIGIVFIAHGFPKITGGPEHWAQLAQMAGFHSAPAFWGFMSALAEFGGGILLIFGFFFHPACLIMLFNMLMAVRFLLSQPPDSPFHQFGSGWSHPLSLAIVFLALFFIGPGRYSLDWLLVGRKRSRAGAVATP